MSVSINGTGSITGIDQGFNITSGSVGIGTDVVGDKLVIHQGSDDDVIVRVNGADSSSEFAAMGVGSGYAAFVAGGTGTTNTDMVLMTSPSGVETERLRISSSGNVGINDTSPAALFTVNNGTNDSQCVFIKNDNVGAYFGTYGTGHASYPREVTINGTRTDGGSSPFLRIAGQGGIKFCVDLNTERLRIGSDGKVLIGSDTGSVHGDRLLQVGKTDRSQTYVSITSSTSGVCGLLFADTTTNDTGGYRGQIRYEHSSDSMDFRTGATERLRIDSNGHLLHGVTADEDTSGSGGLRFINSGDIQIDGDQKALVFRSTSNTAQLQSAIEWWNENGAGVQSKIACDRTAVSQAPGDLVFYTSPNVDTGGSSSDGDIAERLRITSSGKVGINYTNPSYMLEVQNPNPGNDSKQLIQRWVNNSQNTLELHMYGGSVDQCQFAATNSEQTLSFLTGVATGNVDSTETSLLLTQNRDAWFQGPDASNYGGGLFIGAEASPYGNLCALRDGNRRPLIYMGGKYPEITLAHTVASNASHGPAIRFATYVQSTNTATGSQFVIGTNGSGTFLDIGHATAGQNVNVHAGIANYAGTMRFRVTTSGCQVNGSLSKSSGSFRIDHPLAGLSTTRDLVHSFIEGPQADLIYRGVVDLVDGTATVNIDTAGRMTEGTFEVLCTNVSCFTSNETDWTAVKGSVSGNILTITAQDNTSTATVSWMVVGERKDPHMIDTDWTDENGRVITEPLKSS